MSSTRYKTVVTKAPGISARTCQLTTCLVHTCLKAQQQTLLPLASGRYVISLTHTRLACVGRGWSNSRLGAQCFPEVESVIWGVKACGRDDARACSQRPTREPNARSLICRRRVHRSANALQTRRQAMALFTMYGS